MNFFWSSSPIGYITLTSKIRGYCKLYYGNGDTAGYTEVLKNDLLIDTAYHTTDKQKLVEFYVDIDDVIKVQESSTATTIILYTLVVEELYAKVTIEDNATYISPTTGFTIEFSDLIDSYGSGNQTNATNAFNNLFNNNYGEYFTFSSFIDSLNQSSVVGSASNNPQSIATNYPDYPNSINWWYSNATVGYVQMTSKISGYCKLYYGNVHGINSEYTLVTKNDIEIDRANVGDFQKLVEFSVNIGDIIKISEYNTSVTALYALVVEAVGNEFIQFEPHDYNYNGYKDENIINIDGSYTYIEYDEDDIYIFEDITRLHTFSIGRDMTADYLIVAGGGRGGASVGSGGGAGGLLQGTIDLQTNETYSIRVGDGGMADTMLDPWSWYDYENNVTFSGDFTSYTDTNLSDPDWVNGVKGKNSYIKNSQNEYITDNASISLLAYGGGAGSNQSEEYLNDNSVITAFRTGGSGGGGGRHKPEGTSGITGQGYSGGNGQGNYVNYGSGGGGGAAGPGYSYNDSNYPGHGGNGVISTITGISKLYAQGGEGSTNGYGGSSESNNVRGGGQIVDGSANGLNGTGGGGGGGSLGGRGGSGVVILRFKKNYFTDIVNNYTSLTISQEKNATPL